jgi:MoaA/NifB/PqqE/SkfB family radical SAM enzyme
VRYKLKEIKIELTYKCNLNCIHCSSDASPSYPLEMSDGVCERLIDEAVELGVEKIAFSGGEPLLWNPLEKAIEQTVKYGIKAVIYSNGNSPAIRKRMQRFRDLGVDKCVFSLFGASARVHESITLKSETFTKTVNAISASAAAGLHTEIHFVPLSSNYKELVPIALLAKKLNVHRISVLRFVPQGRGSSIAHQCLNTSENLILKRTIQYLRTNGCHIRTGSPYNFLLLNNQPKCTVGIDKLTIGPDLKIYPCDAFKQITAESVALNYS